MSKYGDKLKTPHLMMYGPTKHAHTHKGKPRVLCGCGSRPEHLHNDHDAAMKARGHKK